MDKHIGPIIRHWDRSILDTVPLEHGNYYMWTKEGGISFVRFGNDMYLFEDMEDCPYCFDEDYDTDPFLYFDNIKYFIPGFHCYKCGNLRFIPKRDVVSYKRRLPALPNKQRKRRRY